MRPEYGLILKPNSTWELYRIIMYPNGFNQDFYITEDIIKEGYIKIFSSEKEAQVYLDKIYELEDLLTNFTIYFSDYTKSVEMVKSTLDRLKNQLDTITPLNQDLYDKYLEKVSRTLELVDNLELSSEQVTDIWLKSFTKTKNNEENYNPR